MNLLIAPLYALTDGNLSDPERRVLLALYSFRNRNSDTVWPLAESIAERALIKDVTRISKITKSLANKGWLEKKRRGFTGGNEYKLMVPECSDHDSKLDAKPKMDTDANLDSDAKLGGDTNTNLDSDTKSKLDCESKNKEQQKELNNELKKNNTKKVLSFPSFKQADFSKWPSPPSEEGWESLLALRKQKRAPLTSLVMSATGKTLHELFAKNISVDQALTVWCMSGWQGIQTQWVINKIKQNQPGGDYANPSNGNHTRRPSLSDRVRENSERQIAEIEKRRRASGNFSGEAVAPVDGDVRAQVYEPIRGVAGQHVGEVLDGDYIASDG